jgi:2-keto-4-pentenoate hydratase/2-oxohepta-3-ene-1,7-dioic acid hydratase in catechol pathway
MTDFEVSWARQFGVRLPGRIVCVGRNYAAHAQEQGVELPTAPLLFAKLSNTVIGPGEAIAIPADSAHVDAEAELALVIGTTARDVTPENAASVIAGYTAANDVSARDFQFGDGQWFRGKGIDTFCPIQHEVAPLRDLTPSLSVIQRLNGEVLQHGDTSDFIFPIAVLVAHITKLITLERGDVILTGTPDGVGCFRDPPITMVAGDVVEVEVQGVPALGNPVVAR